MRRRRSAFASPPSGENDFRRHVVWNTHTMDSISRDSPTPKRPKTERETPLGLPRGAFLCYRRAANTSRMLSSGVFRVCFGFFAVVIRLSGKCRLKSTLRGSSTFTAERLSCDSPTLSDSRGATPSDSPTPSDSQRLTDSQRLSDYQRLSTFDLRVARHPRTMRRDPARHVVTPRGRRDRLRLDRPRLVSHDRPRCGGSPAPPGAAKARPNAAPYIGAIDKRKSL